VYSLSSTSPIWIGGLVRWLVDLNLRRKLAHRRNKFAQQLHPLSDRILMLRGRAGHVVAGSRETGNETGTYGVAYDREDDRDRCGRLLRSQCRCRAVSHNYRHIESHKRRSERGELLNSPFRPAIFDGEVAALRPPMVLEPLHEGRHPFGVSRRARRPQEPYGRQLRRLLRVRRERHACRRTADKCDELAPLHGPPKLNRQHLSPARD